MSKVKIISDTIQEFNGVRYYLCGSYFQNSEMAEKRLHRVVWVYHNGEIPSDCHIHHLDHDVTNNDISNLVCLSGEAHARYHAENMDSERFYRFWSAGVEAAREWHASDEGIEWHKKQYELTKDRLHALHTYNCKQCGTSFEATKNKRDDSHRFCGRNCKAAWRRESGIDDEPRDCEYCKQEFMCNKYQKTKYCSSDCKKSAMREAREKAKA